MNEAVRADAGLAEVQTSQGLLNVWLEWNWPLAEQKFRQAIVLNPGYALAHVALANVLSLSGRHGDATEESTRARQLDPLDAMVHAISSQLAFQRRDYSSASAHARQAILIDSELWVGHAQLGQTLAQMGQTDLALQSLVEAERLSGGNSKALSMRGYVLAKAGRASEARVVLEELMKRGEEGYVPPVRPGARVRRPRRPPIGVRRPRRSTSRARRSPRFPDGRSQVGRLPPRAAVQTAARTVRVHESALRMVLVVTRRFFRARDDAATALRNE